MGRKKIIVIALFLLVAVCAAKGEQKRLDVTLDLTYRSKSLSKGILGYGSSPAIVESVDLEFWDSGFGIGVTHQWATNGGWVSKDKFKYDVYYKSSLFDDTLLHTDYKLRWRYKSFYKRPARNKDSQQLMLKMEWPKVLGIENLYPYGKIYYEWPGGRHYDNHDCSAWLYLIGLGYDLAVDGWDEPICFGADIMYRGGGGTRDHDWSHATIGMSSEFAMTENISFEPQLYYQVSMEDSVCQENDIFYCYLSFKYKF